MLALDRDTGQLVWCSEQISPGYVSLLLDGDRLIVSAAGHIYCLDPLTGQTRWQNRLQGHSTDGPVSLVSARGQSPPILNQQAAAVAAAAAAFLEAGERDPSAWDDDLP